MATSRSFGTKKFQLLVLLLLLILLGAAGWFTLEAEHLASLSYQSAANTSDQSSSKSNQVHNFNDCIAAGNPLQQNSPPVCTTQEGKRFVNN